MAGIMIATGIYTCGGGLDAVVYADAIQVISCMSCHFH